MRRPAFIPFLFGFLLAFDPFLEVWAYLDPGTGSMILQLLLGGIAGAVIVLKLYWQRFLTLFKGNSSDSKPSESDDENS